MSSSSIEFSEEVKHATVEATPSSMDLTQSSSHPSTPPPPREFWASIFVGWKHHDLDEGFALA